MKSRFSIAATVVLFGLSGIVFAENTVVTLTSSGDGSAASATANRLWDSAGVDYHWSDGNAPNNPNIDYVVNNCALAAFNTEFGGKSLTFTGSKAYMRPYSGATTYTIQDLRFANGAKLNIQLASGTQTFVGTLTLDDSTATAPFSIVGGKSGQTYDIAMAFKGNAVTVLETGACYY